MPFIDFRHLPRTANGFSKLFNDYLSDFSKLKQFYSSDFHSFDDIVPLARKAQKTAVHRTELAKILVEQNKMFGAGDRSVSNADSLRNENTFCVVTGQQVSLLGGPLYTLYKCYTAIKLSQRLQEQFPDYHFIPVFWLEGEDHDFAEANNVTLLTAENTATRIEYLVDGKPTERNLGAVGELVFNEQLDVFLGQTEKTLPPSEFKASLFAAVRDSYTQGRSFNNCFARWMTRLCDGLPDDAGLVFVSSNDVALKRMLGPVFLKELQDFPKTSQLVIDQSAVLEREYHAQIKPKAVNLFLFYKGGRYLIEPRESDFALKGTRYYPTRDELRAIASNNPDQLSPNVVLRTISQDTLLPTVAYVAGPSEIAYFAQLKPVYEYFQTSMPMIYPRASATIVEQKLRTVMEKYELGISDFFGHREKLNDRVIDLLSEVNLDELLSGTGTRIAEVLAEIQFGLNYIDPTLTGALETARAKIESQLRILKEKAAAAQRRKHEIALKQIDKVFNNVFPNGNVQERELNIIHFANKYGLDFPARLFRELQADAFAHQVIEL